MPKPFTFRILGSRPLYRGFTKFDMVDFEVVTRAGETKHIAREIEDHGRAVTVLPYDPARREAVLVRQLRVPIAFKGEDDAYPLETIAGLMDVDGEGPEETARREAREEAGLALGALDLVAIAYATPGLSTERVHLFLAEIALDEARQDEGGGADHEGEDIEVMVLPLADLAARVDRHEIRDLKTVTLVQSLRLKRPELFAG
ncbi:NUDIX domain-containing protein [Prosthecomicrobium sp. N25]|uniref:NUDIX domain-containing protein n=1 Tax=Prosthecomicrobium sp. N25 TaxID=3129254 RepID=UPI0030780B4F